MTYTYAGPRAKALQNKLLSENELEMLLSAKSFEEAYKNLHQTFFYNYITKQTPQNLPYILESVVEDAKKTLISIAPKPHLLDVLWLKYDFYNLGAIIKSTMKSIPEEEIEKMCFKSGKYPPQLLVKKYTEGKMIDTNVHLLHAAKEAKNYKEVSDIGRAMNINYFRAVKEIAENNSDQFVKKYISLIIDLFNVRANLRALSYGKENEPPYPIFISGGSFKREATENKEELLKKFSCIGGESACKECTDEYKETGSLRMIEKRCDEHITQFIKESSYNAFSIAPLFSYFQGVKNNVQIVRIILVAKRTGMSEYDLRKILRRLYV